MDEIFNLIATAGGAPAQGIMKILTGMSSTNIALGLSEKGEFKRTIEFYNGSGKETKTVSG